MLWTLFIRYETEYGHLLHICFRNKDIKTLDETFWEKSFAFHTASKPTGDKPSDTDTALQQEYQTTDWAPKFLQPVLQQIVLTGKSMEMLEGLGKLAEHDGRVSAYTQGIISADIFKKMQGSQEYFYSLEIYLLQYCAGCGLIFSLAVLNRMWRYFDSLCARVVFIQTN